MEAKKAILYQFFLDVVMKVQIVPLQSKWQFAYLYASGMITEKMGSKTR